MKKTIAEAVSILAGCGAIPNTGSAKNDTYIRLQKEFPSYPAEQIKEAAQKIADSHAKPRSLYAYLQRVMGEPWEMADPLAEEQAGKPHDIQAEIAEEAKLEQERREWNMSWYGREIRWTEPNDPRLFEKPSYLDTLPPELRRLYAENTYVSLKREAEKEGTSVQEICRRKGISFPHVIW